MPRHVLLSIGAIADSDEPHHPQACLQTPVQVLLVQSLLQACWLLSAPHETMTLSYCQGSGPGLGLGLERVLLNESKGKVLAVGAHQSQ